MKEEIFRVLRLAHLSFDEVEELEDHFNKVLKIVERLKEVDTSDVEPLYYPHENVNLRMRGDVLRESFAKIEVLQNAPDTFTDYIKTISPLKGIAKKTQNK